MIRDDRGRLGRQETEANTKEVDSETRDMTSIHQYTASLARRVHVDGIKLFE